MPVYPLRQERVTSKPAAVRTLSPEKSIILGSNPQFGLVHVIAWASLTMMEAKSTTEQGEIKLVEIRMSRLFRKRLTSDADKLGIARCCDTQPTCTQGRQRCGGLGDGKSGGEGERWHVKISPVNMYVELSDFRKKKAGSAGVQLR